MVHSIWSKLSCVVGTVTGLPVTIAELESSFQRMTKELAETVKAIIDSKMGELGSVCALSVEEFIGKYKSAMGHLAASSVPGGSGVEQVCRQCGWKHPGVLWMPVVHDLSASVKCPMFRLLSRVSVQWLRKRGV